MVRLDVGGMIQVAVLGNRFNSNMVRLDVPSCLLYLPSSLVSIPIWCDQMLNSPITWFWQTYVSIPIWCDQMNIGNRTKRQGICVSIPIWCDQMNSISLQHSERFRFQFQYGAIRWMLKVLEKDTHRGFNSNMVRLDDESHDEHLDRQSGFNSNMVRLDETSTGTLGQIAKVSIPIWCDQMPLKLPTVCENGSMFQFQYGAIRCLIRLNRIIRLVSFNSNMVRLDDNYR